MSSANLRSGLQLRSLVKKSAELELSLLSVVIPEVAPGEVLVRIDASPINPSDIGLMFAAADMSKAQVTGTSERPVVIAPIPSGAMPSLAGRLEVSMPVGNEGAGRVVAAGSSAEAQALKDKSVAVIAGGMYAQYRSVAAEQCVVLPEGTTAAEGASAFVNPLTALAMLETMRREGHTALVHTAAASNLGQMLQRVCLEDGVPLINIVRSFAQQELLVGLGAAHVCNSTAPSFKQDLTEAIVETGATIGFDATGGGKLAGQILSCMEAALGRNSREYSRYGTTTHKQLYIYGALEPGPTELKRDFGFSWGMGGWLVFEVLKKLGPEVRRRLQQRVVTELKTTFASHYSKEVSLAEALQVDVIAAYLRRATGEKFLINPNRR